MELKIKYIYFLSKLLNKCLWLKNIVQGVPKTWEFSDEFEVGFV